MTERSRNKTSFRSAMVCNKRFSDFEGAGKTQLMDGRQGYERLGLFFHEYLKRELFPAAALISCSLALNGISPRRPRTPGSMASHSMKLVRHSTIRIAKPSTIQTIQKMNLGSLHLDSQSRGICWSFATATGPTIFVSSAHVLQTVANARRMRNVN